MPNPPLVLAFDTSAAHCMGALLSGEDVLAFDHKLMQRGQAEQLFPMLENLLAKAQGHWSDLDLVACGIGPGNFTGIRVSVAAARGIALGLDIPAFGVSSFDALCDGHPNAVPVVPARRDQVYMCYHNTSSIFLPEDSLPMAWMGMDIVAEVAIPWLEHKVGGRSLRPHFPLAISIARIALHRRTFESTPQRPKPLYLRPADAALPSDKPPVVLS